MRFTVLSLAQVMIRQGARESIFTRSHEMTRKPATDSACIAYYIDARVPKDDQRESISYRHTTYKGDTMTDKGNQAPDKPTDDKGKGKTEELSTSREYRQHLDRRKGRYTWQPIEEMTLPEAREEYRDMLIAQIEAQRDSIREGHS